MESEKEVGGAFLLDMMQWRGRARDKRREKGQWKKRKVFVYFPVKPVLCLVCVSVCSSGASTAGL